MRSQRRGCRRETNPFPVRVLVLLVCFVQIHAVETADGERHDDLDEAEDGMQDVGEGHLGAVEDAHFAGGSLFAFAGCRLLNSSASVRV